VVIIVSVFAYFSPNSQAQTNTTFTPSDKFSIPELNGTINFAVNGSCSAETLENGTWTFKDLTLNSSQSLGNLKVSVESSNITISSYRVYNLFGRSALLRYTAEGIGKQTINLGLNFSQPTSASEWSIIAPGNVFLAQG
jgi:hypothetical protein